MISVEEPVGQDANTTQRGFKNNPSEKEIQNLISAWNKINNFCSETYLYNGEG